MKRELGGVEMHTTRLAIAIAGFLLLISSAQATTVSLDEAEHVARAWLSSNAPESEIEGSVGLQGSNGLVLGRVFDIAPAGWVAVSQVRELAPVIAYSLDDESFGEVSLEGSIGELLKNTLQESVAPFVHKFGDLDYRPRGSEADEYGRNYSLWSSLLQGGALRTDGMMNAMLTSSWNQSWPYNAQCPQIDGQYALAGCVAIALAQIMRYHEFPARGALSTLGFSYIAPCCGLITAYNHDEYDWANMTDSIYSWSPQVEIDAVAELCFEIGVSCLMDYGVNASGAWEDRVPPALVDHLGYRDQIQHVLRENYGDVAWFEFIQNELNHNRPIFYVFYSEPDARHAMVADGWKVETVGGNTTRWIHLNYGWGGLNNRFFLLNEVSVHRPDVDEVYCNIEPPEGWQRINPLDLVHPKCAAWGDYDNDGYPDLFLGGEWGISPNTLFRNVGGYNLTDDGTLPRYVHGAAWGDYDNDGNLDLAVAGAGVGIFRNSGGGQFAEVQNASSIPQGYNYSALCWGDYDSDGLLDLVVSSTEPGESVRVLRNLGSGTPRFSDTTPQELQGIGKVHAVLWTDMNNDGVLDLALFGVGNSYEFETKLYQGLGGGNYIDVTGTSGVNGYSQSGSFGDVDGDGDLDLYIAMAPGGQLYRNLGNFSFSEITSDDMEDMVSDFASSGVFGDIDNDGDLDLYVTATTILGDPENALFLNDGSGNMLRSLSDLDLQGNSPGDRWVAAWADMDLDGDLDLVCDGWSVEHDLGWVRCYVMRNESMQFGHGLNVSLEGTRSNARGIGSVVTVGAGPGVQTRVLEGSSTGRCQNWVMPHFGIPTTGTPRVSVAWPSGSISVRPATPQEISQLTIAEISVVGVDDELRGVSQVKVQAHPNPSNGRAILSCEVPFGGRLEIDLYNIAGAHLARLYSHTVSPGGVDVPIAFNHGRGEMPSGVYFVRVSVDGECSWQKLAYVK